MADGKLLLNVPRYPLCSTGAGRLGSHTHFCHKQPMVSANYHDEVSSLVRCMRFLLSPVELLATRKAYFIAVANSDLGHLLSVAGGQVAVLDGHRY